MGRPGRTEKRGAITGRSSPILDRLSVNINADTLVDVVADFPRGFRRVAGWPHNMLNQAQREGRQWLYGFDITVRASQ